jgi:hypothetical protein
MLWLNPTDNQSMTCPPKTGPDVELYSGLK